MTLLADGPDASASPAGDASFHVVKTVIARTAASGPSPATITVRLSQPLSRFTVGTNDLDLTRVDADNSSTTPIDGPGLFVEDLGADGRSIVLNFRQGLAPGHYRLTLDPNSEVAATDGTPLDLSAVAGHLIDFAVRETVSGSLASAVDLGTITATDRETSGQLDLADDPNYVAMYQIHLADGEPWQLGLALSSPTGDAAPAAILALFDDRGSLLKASQVGAMGQLGDPYLFAGLAPGTYYVGVSGVANDPRLASGYHPDQGTAGTGAGEATGGPFVLHAVANPAGAAATVLGVRVDHDLPNSTEATGFTLQFDAAVDPTSVSSRGKATIRLVDDSGVAWLVVPRRYDAATGQLSFLFSQDLPAGRYSIAATAATGPGLTDLAGRRPVASGQPAGVLGTLTIASTPDGTRGMASIVDIGYTFDQEVAPGATTSATLNVLETGYYLVDGIRIGTDVTWDLLDADGGAIAVPASGGPIYLGVGAYQLRITNSGATATTPSLAIRRSDNLLSSLLDAGVGQVPPLALRVINPEANFGQSTTTRPTGSPSTTPAHLAQIVNQVQPEAAPTVATSSPTGVVQSSGSPPTIASTTPAVSPGAVPNAGTPATDPSTSAPRSANVTIGPTELGGVGTVSAVATGREAGAGQAGKASPGGRPSDPTGRGDDSARLSTIGTTIVALNPVGRPLSQNEQISIVVAAGNAQVNSVVANGPLVGLITRKGVPSGRLDSRGVLQPPSDRPVAAIEPGSAADASSVQSPGEAYPTNLTAITTPTGGSATTLDNLADPGVFAEPVAHHDGMTAAAIEDVVAEGSLGYPMTFGLLGALAWKWRQAAIRPGTPRLAAPRNQAGRPGTRRPLRFVH